MNLLFTPNQERVFICLLLTGVLLGVVYDVFKIKRMIIPCGNLLLFVDDLLYLAFCSVAIIVSVFVSNRGILRWYEFFGALLGFVLYRITLSRIVLLVFTYVIDVIKRGVKAIGKILLFPFKSAAVYINNKVLLPMGKRRKISKSKRKIIKYIKKIRN